MIKWKYNQLDLLSYEIDITDEHGHSFYGMFNISSPALSILIEILTDYKFAMEINHTDSIFNLEELSKEDQMDIKLMSLCKLEDADND